MKAYFSLGGWGRIAFYPTVIFLVGGGVWATFGGFARAGGGISRSDREEAIRTTVPVIAAIRLYETANNSLPVTLADLIPRYLSRLPQPPAAVSPGSDYLYAVESGTWRIGVPVRGERDGVLTYSSTGDYPPGKPGTSVERVGDWAYYHGNPF